MPRHHCDENTLAICIASNTPIFSHRLFQLLSDSGVKTVEIAPPNRKLKMFGWAWKLYRTKSKIIHYLWGTNDPLIYIIPKLMRKKVIIHWIGSDVTGAISNKREIFNNLLRKIAYKAADKHLADFEPLADELNSLGIHARVIILPPDIPPLRQDISWPLEHRVFVYLPERRQAEYGSDIIFRLAEEMPSINFLITSHSGKSGRQLPNINYLGLVNDMESIWKQVKVHIRLNKHDGLSHAVIEALARAKHVIWSYEYPCCHQARTFEEARDALINILRQNQPNINGMDYVYEQFGSLKLAREYKSIYLEVLGVTE